MHHLQGLTIIATVVVGIFRFDQMPNLYSIIGLVLYYSWCSNGKSFRQ